MSVSPVGGGVAGRPDWSPHAALVSLRPAVDEQNSRGEYVFKLLTNSSFRYEYRNKFDENIVKFSESSFSFTSEKRPAMCAFSTMQKVTI